MENLLTIILDVKRGFNSTAAISIAINIIALGYILWKKWRDKLVVPNPGSTICTDSTIGSINELQMGSESICELLSTFRSSTNSSTDTSSVWFDLKTLKSFMYHVETQALQRDPSITDDKLGVRFYFVKYPQSSQTGLVIEDDCENMQTLLMMPTLTDNGIPTDFNVFNGQTYSQCIVHSGSNAGTMITTGQQVPPFLAKNHGSLIPPISPEGEAFC